jgi:hypothetical protein
MEPRLSNREACSPGHQQEIQARGSEVGSGERTAEESPPAGRVTDETAYFRFADHTPGIVLAV